MRALMRSTWKSLAQLFLISLESSGNCFHLFNLNRFRLRNSLAERFIYKRSLVITEADCCNVFERFSNGGKAKIPQRVVRKFVSTGLYCACAQLTKSL